MLVLMITKEASSSGLFNLLSSLMSGGRSPVSKAVYGKNVIPLLLGRILLFGGVGSGGDYVAPTKKPGSDLLLKSFSERFNKIPVFLRKSVPLPSLPMHAFLFLTLQALDNFFLNISKPKVMLTSFSYSMLHFAQIAEVGKYLFFFKIFICKKKIPE